MDAHHKKHLGASASPQKAQSTVRPSARPLCPCSNHNPKSVTTHSSGSATPEVVELSLGGCLVQLQARAAWSYRLWLHATIGSQAEGLVGWMLMKAHLVCRQLRVAATVQGALLLALQRLSRRRHCLGGLSW